MRESSLHHFPASDPRSGFGPSAKSLFRDILAASPYGSGFWPSHSTPRARKLLAMSILRTTAKKNEETSPRCKSSLDRGYPWRSVDRRQQEGVVITILGAVAGDLADVVDGVGVDQHPTGVGRDEGIQILHAPGRGPDHGMRGVVKQVAVA